MRRKKIKLPETLTLGAGIYFKYRKEALLVAKMQGFRDDTFNSILDTLRDRLKKQLGFDTPMHPSIHLLTPYYKAFGLNRLKVSKVLALETRRVTGQPDERVRRKRAKRRAKLKILTKKDVYANSHGQQIACRSSARITPLRPDVYRIIILAKILKEHGLGLYKSCGMKSSDSFPKTLPADRYDFMPVIENNRIAFYARGKII